MTPGHTCCAWSPALVPLVGYGVLTLPQDMHPHGGSHTSGGREDRTAVLGAFLDSIPQPAEHMGPATWQRKCLHRDTYLQLTSILLPDNANIRRTWRDKDHLHLHSPPLGSLGDGAEQKPHSQLLRGHTLLRGQVWLHPGPSLGQLAEFPTRGSVTSWQKFQASLGSCS